MFLKEDLIIWFDCKGLLNPFKLKEFPTLINEISTLSFQGLLGGIFHRYSNFHIIFCKQHRRH